MVALGTAPNSTTRSESAKSFQNAVLMAIEAGFRHIDTASIYETEPFVGRAIAESIAKDLVTREDLFVTTKLWSTSHARDQVVPALKESLQNMNLDYVDLYLMHFPMAITPDGGPLGIDYLETWRGLEECKSLGLAKSIGVSNFNTTQLTRLLANCKIRPAVNEVEVNPTYNNAPIISLCHRKSIKVMGYSPFGFLVPRRREGYNCLPPQFDHPLLVKMAKKYKKTTAQIVLRYEVERGVIPIPKSLNKKHLKENIDIFDFSLTRQEVKTIGKFNKNIKVWNAPEKKDFPYYPFIPW